MCDVTNWFTVDYQILAQISRNGLIFARCTTFVFFFLCVFLRDSKHLDLYMHRFVYGLMLEINWTRSEHVSSMQSSCIYRCWWYTVTGIVIAIVAAAIAAHAIIVHVACELLPLRFVLVVLLTVHAHAHATAARIDVCDALATTAITAQAKQWDEYTNTHTPTHTHEIQVLLCFQPILGQMKTNCVFTCCYCCYFAVSIGNIADCYWMATILFGPMNVTRSN